MKKWEYLRIQTRADMIKELDEKLSELGEEGWELVSAVWSSGGSSWIQYVHLFLKRLKE